MRARYFYFLGVFFLAAGCSTYKQQVVPFKAPTSYKNVTSVAGASIAAKAYDDPKEAKQAFGWDIRESGLYPVHLVFDNLGDKSLEIDPSQTFLLDVEGNIWTVLDRSLAYSRVGEASQLSRVGKAAVKPGILGGAAGALLGAAIGIVSGQNVIEAAGKGAALGGAAGATLGGAEAMGAEGSARSTISNDLQKKSLENRAVAPHSIAHGFLFFPGEAKKAAELRLRLRVVETGELLSLRFSL